MSGVLIEFGGDLARWKRDLKEVETSADDTARRVEQSFQRARESGFARIDKGLGSRVETERWIQQRTETMRNDAEAREIARMERNERRTREHARRLNEEARETERSRSRLFSRDTANVAALAATAMAVRESVEAYREYAEVHNVAGASTDRTTSALGRLRQEIGRTLALSGAGGGVDRLGGAIIDGMTGAYRHAQMTAVEMRFGLQTRHELDTGTRRMEAETVERARAEAFRREELRLEAEAAAARGDTEGAAEIRRRMASEDYARQLNEMTGQGALTAQQASELAARQRAIRPRRDDSEARAREEARRAAESAAVDHHARLDSDRRAMSLRGSGFDDEARIVEIETAAALERRGLSDDLSRGTRERLEEAIRARADAAIAGVRREAEARKEAAREEREQALESYQLTAEQARIDELRDQGHATRAALLAEELRLRREISQINRDDRLTEEDRLRLIDEATDRSERAQERIGRGPEVGGRGVESGIAHPLVLARVLGGGGTVDAKLLTEAQRHTALLERIEEKSGVYA